MSVITNLPAVPNRVAIVYRFLQGYDEGMREEELRGLLSPSALKSGDSDDDQASTMADDVLREVKALGLLEEAAQGMLRVPRKLRGMDDSALTEHLERTLLDAALAKEAGQAQFASALAWLLVQDPAKPLNFADNQSDLVKEDCGSDSQAFELTNPKRFQNLVYWARYLGYVWRFDLGGGSNLVMPDPTAALDRHIRGVLRERREGALAELVALLAQRCPVLENGHVRREVEERLPAQKRRPDDALSRSTSLALLRLERRGTITLERRADAPALRLTSWPDARGVSHVILRG